ncbi:hypothetical protein [Curtobacterium aetherium]|uniref:Uncharacterized protein n=1 Tax=Curtobacterium aetherium TaxID=2841594 RepID=A0ACD1E337_9MICO|nr:hypothetical protein [Curtobacterium sp. L6-1]QWS33164.1 hypothetical protein KM842_13070 [Curtobacterium sp. L6-1]
MGALLCGGAFLAGLVSAPDGGADIGAGALLFAGQPLVYAGVVFLVVSLVRSAGPTRPPRR